MKVSRAALRGPEGPRGRSEIELDGLDDGLDVAR
jgi:hypothetical protein